MASPFVSKLASLAVQVHAERPFDVIFSHYLEPYGVAAHLAAEMSGAPHVARMAGSDAGRLWHHRQLAPLYDHVLRSAQVVIGTGPLAERLIQHGVEPARIAFGGGYAVPEDLFVPDGVPLDLTALRAEVEVVPELRDFLWGDFAGDRPYFGVYGKLGERKGSFAILAAMHRLKRAGLEAGLLALAHGPPAVERAFRARVRKLGLADRVLQIPFLPPWRVPEFLRSCLAVCCLEQDFPIAAHAPIVPLEVLTCGACLVASTELLRKLPAYARLPHGYGCVAIEDVNDIEALSARFAGIVTDPAPTAAVGMRGRKFAMQVKQNGEFPEQLERVLWAAARRQPTPQLEDASVATVDDPFHLTRLAFEAAEKITCGRKKAPKPLKQPVDLSRARNVLATVERKVAEGNATLIPLIPAINLEIAMAEVASQAGVANVESADPLFRLHIGRWALQDGDLPGLVPVRDPQVRVIAFEHDVSQLFVARALAELPATLPANPSYVVTLGGRDRMQRGAILVDQIGAIILELCDGTRTVSQIIDELHSDDASSAKNEKWIEQLFLYGLISLHQSKL
jgi:glycosyltransferase involved in cell wall biosynthesis